MSAVPEPAGLTRWWRRHATVPVAILTACALIATLDGGATAEAAARAPKDKIFQPRKEESVGGADAKAIPRRTDQAEAKALTAAPAVAWPKAGSAEVAVPSPAAPAVAWNGVLSGSAKVRPGPAARAGELPVWVGPTAAANRAAAAAVTPARVKVDLLGRDGDRLLLRLASANKAGQVELRVDYSGFAQAYGADWNSRLRLVQLPECALKTPDAAACAGTPIATRNDGSGLLAADVPAAGVFAMEAAAAGGAGDFGASSLSPATSWQVGGSSGDFNWRYPMETPPGLGGPASALSLEYSSGGVDGRTSATNNQPSWAGEGFELEPGGSIERRYAACASKTEKTGNNGSKKVGDLCWATDNAYFSLNGRGGELVRDDATGAWKPRSDDGTVVQRLTGGSNGDNNGEYWLMTTEDGTKYYFGLNRLAGWTSGKPETKSTWTVPVFGNHSGEPCHDDDFGDSYCQQGYRWNLDYVVDRHGNTMSLFYDTETNNYGRNASASSVSTYTRAGNINRIEYGQRDGSVYTTPAVARVLFTTGERCIGACTSSQPATYPDTPWDQSCTSSSSCKNKLTPTFWTQKRIAKVTTEVWRGTAFTPVNSWTFRHSFPAPGDGTRAGLWLEAISNAGLVGGQAETPETSFDGVQLPNRVVGTEGIPAMNWWRISGVHTGTGGELTVGYSAQDCSLPGNVPAPDTNGKRCHPAKWTPDGLKERQDWFNKFVVTDVTESDRVSGLEPIVTKVEYLSPPAWHHDEEDGLVDIDRKTWAQWRGYERVRVTKGHPSGTQSVTENRFFRGMDGDKLANGGVKDVQVTDSTGVKVEDVDPLAGQAREEIKYNGTAIEQRSITDQFISAPTATRVRSWGTTKAYEVEEAAVRQYEAVDGTWRQSSSKNTYNAAGALTQQDDFNNLADATDDTCTRFSYTENPAKGLREIPVRRQTVAQACDKPWTNADVTADQRLYYDGSTTPGGVPTTGDLTRSEELSGFAADGTPTYKVEYTTVYDAIGRAVESTDALNRTRKASYTPTGASPVTQVVETAPNGHVTTTALEPAWGEELTVTEPDGRKTELAYDPLGRTSRVWTAGRSRSDAPNYAYGYTLRGDGPGVVSTTTLQADNSFETTLELTDGLLRPRQMQEPAPGGGRVITDYVYDSRGLQVKENGPYYNSAPPTDQVLIPNEAQVPTQQVTTYDQLDRPLAQVLKSRNTEKWRTTYSQTAGRFTTVPPAGEHPVTRITDVEGRLTELRTYTGDDASGSYDSTLYTYHPAGQLATVKDPAGNLWKFDYDIRGRQISAADPDKGTTRFTYDDEDRMLTSTDARGGTVAFAYDELDRPTAVHDGSLAGPKRAEWTYDTLAKGAPTSATRYVNGQAYTVRVTGYNEAGKPLGAEVTLPAAEGQLAGTYQVKSTYNADGEIASTDLPGVGGLPAETLRYGYNAQDMPTTLTGASSYVTGTTYTPYGETESVTLAQSANGPTVKRKYEYEEGTRRLSRVVTERDIQPELVSDTTYGFDPAGNVKSITDKTSASSGEAADTQCFDYDHLRRLAGAWTPASGDCAAAPTAGALGGPAPYWQSWTFDKVGNRQSETRHAAGGDTTSTYRYPDAGQARPHAVQGITTTTPAGSTTKNYGYDATGNLTDRTVAGVGETFAWDVEGHLEKVTKNGKTTSFVYDADGNRLLRRDTAGTTFYFGEAELLLEPDGKVTGTRYYRHSGQTVAVRTPGKLHWLGTDHHGTPNLAIDADNQSFERRRTTPYGEARGAAPASWPGQKGFVGGGDDPSTGLVHLEAREYDSTTGRFISVDPIADYQDAQQLNGYAYANNSPTTYTDPDGQWGFIIGIIVRIIPIVVRVAQLVVQAIKVVVPVVRDVVIAMNVGGKIVQVVRQVTQMVAKIKNVVKQLIRTVQSLKRILTRTAKRVGGSKSPTVRNIPKKPNSAGKPQARSGPRNTQNAKEKAPLAARVKPPKQTPKERRAVRKAAKKQFKDEGYWPSGQAATRKVGLEPKGPSQPPPPRDFNGQFRFGERPDPWSYQASKGDPLDSADLARDGMKRYADQFHKYGYENSTPTTGSKVFYGLGRVGQLAAKIAEILGGMGG
ncbi:RHS repeat domain-containing protein [Kribbella sp. NPDC058245]|uniref:RHS repeat domain-containing protein n=1 Tax=Kribbella sp. NPDC058245 TaxID=3346399 RepID=UPI0036E72F3C